MNKKTATKGKRKPTTKRTTNLVPMLVTTGAHRGVFFGYGDPESLTEKVVRLERARNCISWARSVGGVFGLAKVGPNRDCTIGSEMPVLRLTDVNSSVECTEAAALAWGAAPCVS